MPSHDDALLRTDLAGMPLRTPVILAAGTAGTLDEMADALDLSRIGAVVTKSITPEAREGNETWRIIGVRAGMLNAIGLANPGIERFGAEIAPRASRMPTTVIGSIAGFSVEDYVRVAAGMDEAEGIPAVELNVSCPNVAHGVEFGADPRLLGELIRAVRPVLSRTRLLVKLPPVAVGTPSSVVDLARAAIDAGAPPSGPNGRPGADGLSLCNTMPAMAIDVRTRRPLLANTTGGLSGPAVHAAVVRLVHEAYRGVARDSGTPIVAIGGVLRWEDAAEFILAGASAVQMGTALFASPRSAIRVTRGLSRWVRREGAGSVSELVGGVRLG